MTAEAILTNVKIQLLGDRGLVKPIEKNKIKRHGIIVSDSAKEKPQEGEVVTCGKGKLTKDGNLIEAFRGPTWPTR